MEIGPNYLMEINIAHAWHLKQTWAMVKFWANVNYFEEPMSIANLNVESWELTTINVNGNVNVLIFLNVNVHWDLSIIIDFL